MRSSVVVVCCLLGGLVFAVAQTLPTPAAEEAASVVVAIPAAPAAETAVQPAAQATVQPAAPAPVQPAAQMPAATAAAVQAPAAAQVKAACPGNPQALGTSRTLAVDPAALPRIGNIQYRHTLPLGDHEVVITFDDGPLPPYTDRVLAALATECVKVTYFLVGQMATAYPDTVRRIYNASHVIGTHSQSHPFHFDAMGQARVEHEVGRGIASVQAALGDPKALAPFFRIPGLARSHDVDTYLASQSLAVWSADEVADDWHRGITAAQIVSKAIRRIEAHDHRGVLLLHDIHPATALAVPTLLKELKARGYRIVQAVPMGERPPSLPERPATQVADAAGGWPRVVPSNAASASEKAEKTEQSRHRLRLANPKAGKDPDATLHAKRGDAAQKTKHVASAQHAKRTHDTGDKQDAASARGERHADISAIVAGKKRKPKTAAQSEGWAFWR